MIATISGADDGTAKENGLTLMNSPQQTAIQISFSPFF
jgi:hypothetical protein